MSNEQERELRQIVNTARQRRGLYRLLEIFAVVVGFILFLVGLTAGGAALDTRQFMIYIAAASFIAAAFYSGYGRVILQPSLNRAQADLNAQIGAEHATDEL
jgi:uncharacterized membrane protein YiaA